MAEFNKRSSGFGAGRRGGFRKEHGRPSFGGRPGFNRGGGRGDERPQLFSAVCATCQKQCEVPFRPSGEKPVYCNDCFRGGREKPQNDFGRGGDRGNQNERGGQAVDGRIDDLKRQVEAMNAKLDTLIKIVGSGSSTAVPAQKFLEKKNIVLDKPKKVLKKTAKKKKSS